MSKFRFYDPKLSGMLDFELIEGLRPPSLYQPTTQEENVRRRYESLRRADRGTSPLRMELYDFLYGTGPTDEQLRYNPNDPQTSLLATRSVAQSGGALDAVDAAARERNRVGSGYGSAAADSAVGGPIETFDYDLQRTGADLLTREGRDILTGRGLFDPNRIPQGAPDVSSGVGTVSPAGNIFQMSNSDLDAIDRSTPPRSVVPPSDNIFQMSNDQLDELDRRLREQGLVGSEVPPARRPDPVQGDNSDTDRVSAVTTNPAPQSVTGQAPTGQEPTTEEGQSRIRSILSMLGDNPELLSALGILGQGVGGMMQSRAQDKANRRANQEQRVNNAIAAFLGGPAEVAQADTATSTGGNILGALGAALGGVGQARMTQRAMDADRESAERIAQIRADANRDVANLNLQGRGGGDDGGGGGPEDANAVLNSYMEALYAADSDNPLRGNNNPVAEFLTQIPWVRRFLPEEVAAVSLNQTAGLALAVAVQGSKPTDKDAEALQMALPTLGDTAEIQQAKLRNLRRLINYGKNVRAQGLKLEDGWSAGVGQNGSFSEESLGRFVVPIDKAGANRFGSLGSAQSVMAGN